jgi:hypothetical protein
LWYQQNIAWWFFLRNQQFTNLEALFNVTEIKMNTFNQFGQPVGEALIDWQPRQHPSRVVLQGRYCRLEPLRVEHADALFSAYSLAEDTRSWTWLLREPDANAEEFAEWVASVSELSDPIHFTVIDNQTQSPVGTLALMRIDPKNGVVEVGHVHFSRC